MKQLTTSGILLGFALLALAIGSSLLSLKTRANHSTADQAEVVTTP